MYTCSGLILLRKNHSVKPMQMRGNIRHLKPETDYFQKCWQGEDKYSYHCCIILNLLLIITQVILIICVHCSSALRQCTTYSNTLFFVPNISSINKRPLAQEKERSLIISYYLMKRNVKKIKEIVCQTCTWGMGKGHLSLFVYSMLCLATDHHLCMMFKLTWDKELCLHSCTMLRRCEHGFHNTVPSQDVSSDGESIYCTTQLTYICFYTN